MYSFTMETSVTWHPPESLDAVQGWLYPKDQAVLTWLLDRQERLEPPGDLVELGCYLGKSAILIGAHRRRGETFTVCDLFDSASENAADERNKSENKWSYSNLTRTEFERNYLSFHPELPTIIQATTDQITDHVAAGSCRFVHIDASHLWQHVRVDIESARSRLRPDGLVVLDDFRSEHTPGVAAAAWTAVANGDLKPICVTSNKFYATWGNPRPVQEELVAWLKGFHRRLPEQQTVLGHTIVRVSRWGEPPLPVLPPLHPAAAPARRRAVPARWTSPRSIARDLLPPVITRALVRAMRGR
jgi:predicted O-methyltransferase YrrM